MDFSWKLESPVIPNTFRRIIYQSIPHYAFDSDSLEIKMNNTAYNNDQLRLKISMIPVKGIENTRKLYLDFVSQDEPSIMEEVMTMVCDVTHNDNTISSEHLRLTTDNFTFSVNGQKIPNPYSKSPMLLCRLRYGDTLSFVAKTRYRCPREHPRYMPVTICYFIKEENGYRFHLEPRHGITGEEVLWRAKDMIIRKLEFLAQKELGDGVIHFDDDQYTLPNLVTHFLQDHPHVLYTGNHCQHQLEQRSAIYYNIQGSDIKKVMTDIIGKIHDKLNSLL